MVKLFSAFSLLIFLLIVPVVAGASGDYIGDRECYACHKELKKTYIGDIHGQIFVNNPRNDLESKGCEACHGRGSEHKDAADRADKGEDVSMMIEAFKRNEGDAKAKKEKCLACHEKSVNIHWRGGSHDMAGLSCDNCHSFHAEGIAVNQEVCFDCHPQIKSKIMRSAHMPIREGKLVCSNCHLPHGGLKTDVINETCYKCHTEKRGPFVWEHAPVRENCQTCHDPHGSNNPGMIVTKGAFLCLRCHQYGGHVNLPRYNRQSATVGQGCLNCHSRVHGSNHPSGAKLTR